MFHLYNRVLKCRATYRVMQPRMCSAAVASESLLPSESTKTALSPYSNRLG